MAGKSLRIGVVGVGFGTAVQIPGFQSEGVEVAAVCARRRDRAEKAASDFGVSGVFDDYREMLAMPDLDAVSIVTPPSLHHEMVLAALDAGKHVLCEKPFALDQDQALEMRNKARDSGLTSMICHEFRYAPGRAHVKELLDQGYVGDLRSVHMSLFAGPSQRTEPGAMDWHGQASRGGGFLGALGSHYIDCMRDWFGDVERVLGGAFALDPARRDTDTGEAVQADADDSFGFMVQFKSGGWGAMSASAAAPFGAGARIDIFGTEGTLQTLQPGFNPPPDGTVLGAKFGDDDGVAELPMPQRFRPFDDDRDQRLMAFRILVRRFVSGVAEGTSPSPNFDDGYRCQQVLDAVRGTASAASWIDVSSE